MDSVKLCSDDLHSIKRSFSILLQLYAQKYDSIFFFWKLWPKWLNRLLGENDWELDIEKKSVEHCFSENKIYKEVDQSIFFIKQ